MKRGSYKWRQHCEAARHQQPWISRLAYTPILSLTRPCSTHRHESMIMTQTSGGQVLDKHKGSCQYCGNELFRHDWYRVYDHSTDSVHARAGSGQCGQATRQLLAEKHTACQVRAQDTTKLSLMKRCCSRAESCNPHSAWQQTSLDCKVNVKPKF